MPRTEKSHSSSSSLARWFPLRVTRSISNCTEQQGPRVERRYCESPSPSGNREQWLHDERERERDRERASGRLSKRSIITLPMLWIVSDARGLPRQGPVFMSDWHSSFRIRGLNDTIGNCPSDLTCVVHLLLGSERASPILFPASGWPSSSATRPLFRPLEIRSLHVRPTNVRKQQHHRGRVKGLARARMYRTRRPGPTWFHHVLSKPCTKKWKMR